MPRTFELRGYQDLTPWEWPQDKVAIPPGQGAMPRVELSNQFTVKQEFFVFADQFTNLAFGAVPTTIVIPTPADGDFWCSDIQICHFLTGTTTVVAASCFLQIKDVRDGHELFFPNARTGFFLEDQTDPFGGEFIQPYCFTRNGGISVTMRNDLHAAAGLDVHIAFIGWKEYRYASR